jgi:hypothetical protein
MPGLPQGRTQYRSGNLLVALTVLLGIGISVYVFSPGFMSPDSLSQLNQARQNSFNDWHPPVMSWVWGQFDRILPGPLGMLIFHNLMFWVGLGLWISLTTPYWNPYLKCVTIFLIGFYPPIFATLSTIWKDVGMAGAFLLAAGLLFYARRSGSMFALLSGAIFIWYGMAVRHNGVIGALPLLIYAGWVLYLSFIKNPNSSNRSAFTQATLLGLGLLGFLWLMVKWVNTQLTQGSSYFPYQQIMVHDLVAVSVLTHEDLIPDFIWSGSNPVTMDSLEKIYSPKGVIPLYNSSDKSAGLKITHDRGQISALSQMWLAAIYHHPKAYLLNRLRVFASEFALNGKKVCYPYHYGISKNDMGLSYTEKPITATIMLGLDKIKNGALFRGWIYILLNILFVVCFLIFKKQNQPLSMAALSVSVSGLFYAIAYLWISPTCDFRLHYWTVIAGMASFVPAISLIRQMWATGTYINTGDKL